VTKKTYDISVLVLCYNASRYIEQCLQSVLDQKHDLNIQLVVLDDASSDDSFAHIENLLHPSSLTEVVTVQNEQNLGCFGNLQKGISLCTGKYIAYLEGDDYWISLTKLQDQFDYLETNSQLAGVGGRCQFVDPTGEELPQKYYTETRDITWSNKTFWNYPPFQASSFMFRRFGNLPGLSKELCCNDKILYVLASVQGDIFYTADVVTAYRYHSENVSHSIKYNEIYRQHLKANTLLLNHLGMSYAWSYISSIMKMTYLWVRRLV